MSFEKDDDLEKMPHTELVLNVCQQLADEQKIQLELLKNDTRTVGFGLQHLALPGFPPLTTLTEEELETFTNHAISRIRDLEPNRNWTEALTVVIIGDGEVEISVDPDNLDE